MSATSPYRLLRPFIWLALAGFMLGFAAVLALQGPAVFDRVGGVASLPAASVAPAVETDASSRNYIKHI